MVGSVLSTSESDHGSPLLALLQAGKLPYPDNSFDTVVQTFGLCSEMEPEAALLELQRVCKPGDTILLLEHGRSGYFGWLNSILDEDATSHASRWGCWWNKDIESIVTKAGLKPETYHTWHFGKGCPCGPLHVLMI